MISRAHVTQSWPLPAHGIRFLLVVMFFMPAVVSADWKDFLPTPYENGAEIRAFASYEQDDNKIGSNRFNWDDTFLREKLTIYSKGYSYDPRFIQYYLSLGGALRQENYSSTFLGDTGWRNDTGLEYNFRLYVLPEHVYNLELFTLRLEPLFKEHSATQRNNVETSRGALFRYRKKPYLLNAKYIETSISSGVSTSNTKTFSTGGSYFKDLGNGKVFSLTGNYTHPNFTNSLGLEGHSDEYVLANGIRNRWLSLNSSMSKGNFDQDSSISGSLKSDQFSWLELLTAELPLNFTSNAQYRYLKNTNTFDGINTSENTQSAIRKEAQIILSHQLYESLNSSYTFRHDSTTSAGGSSKSLSNFGNLDYIRRTRWGVLLAGMNFGRSDTESSGQTSVVNESHTSTPVPGSFLLNESQQIDPLSIEVFLRSPLPPNELILLQENVHYTVASEAATFRISIFSLPPQFVIPDSYDFLVTYSLTAGEFKLQTDTFGYRVSFDLFDTLMPYHSYGRSTPEVLSGEFPGIPFDSTTRTTGLVFHRGGFRLLGEHQKLDWEVSPYRAYRVEARYTGSLTDTLRLNAAAEYLNRYYPKGSYLEAARAYTEERTTASSSIQKELFRRSLLFSFGGSYSHFLGFNVGNAYSVNSTLSWRIAKLDFTLGATAYHSDSEGPVSPTQRRTHQYYFLNVGRKIF